MQEDTDTQCEQTINRLANKYKGYSGLHNLEDDFKAVGRDAVRKAGKKYDPNRGTQFCTYAFKYINGAMQKIVSDEYKHINYKSKSEYKREKAILHAHDELMESLGRAPTINEISDYTKMAADIVEKMICQIALQQPSITNRTPKNNGENDEDEFKNIPDKTSSTEEILIMKDLFVKAMRTLSRPERKCIELQCIEFQYNQEMDLKKIAEIIGRSEKATKQLCYRARKKIREFVQNN